MNEFSALVEKYLQFDKKTLAELLAIKEMTEKNYDNTIQPNPYPNITPRFPDFTYPYYPTWPPKDGGDWVVTCSSNKK